MNIDFPFHFDSRGRTAGTGDDDHIRDMIEQLLFTNPGERVNRPDFGSGLQSLIFGPNSPEVAAAGKLAALAGRPDRATGAGGDQRGFDFEHFYSVRGASQQSAAGSAIHADGVEL